MRSNPYERFLGKEDRLHHAILTFIKLQYPKALVAHPVNEGKRSRFEQFKIKWLGISPGIIDILIFTPGTHKGLGIEVKAKGNKPTPDQMKWIAGLNDCGWKAIWVNDLHIAVKEINSYFSV